jgi:hypothetical protein
MALRRQGDINERGLDKDDRPVCRLADRHDGMPTGTLPARL